MFAAITSFFATLTESLKAYETHILEQGNSELVKSKNRLKKATDVAEELIFIMDKYTHSFEGKDLSKYNKLKKKFMRLN